MLLATPCRCVGGPRTFEINWCQRCGRMLEVAFGDAVFIDGWAMLDARIEMAAKEVRAQAANEGVDVTDPDAYLDWLADSLARDN